jgi:outer membrane protein assembly factor BamB
MRGALLGLMLSFCCRPAGLQASDWPQFRGPRGDGIAQDGTTLASEWSPEKHVAWKKPIPGFGWSQPIVWGGKIFVTTAEADELEQPRQGEWNTGISSLALLGAYFNIDVAPPKTTCRWKVLCLDLATGSTLWEQLAREGRPAIHTHPNNGYASETPVTDGERLIAYFGMTGVYCYDLTGKPLWTKDLGSYSMQFGWGTGSSPVLYDNRVFIQCDNEKGSFLVGLDAKSGDEVWRVQRDEKSNWSTPYIWKNKERVELVTGGGTKMRSYEPASGKLLWEMNGSGRCSVTPVGDQEMLYITSGDRISGRTGILAGIKAGGSGDISLQASETKNASVVWTTKLTTCHVASPLLFAGCLYTLEQQSGIVRCFDAKTGKENYRQRLAGATGFSASPFACGDKVYILDQTSQTHVLESGPEFKPLTVNKLDGEMCWGSAAIAGNKLLIRSLGHLYCIAP